MANDNTDISDIVKKCKILLLDIEGTTTSISFVKDKLFPYAEENVKEFLNNGWETDDVKEAVAALRKLALEDQENSIDGVVTIPGEDASKEDQIDGLVKSVKWHMSSDRKVGALKLLQGLIWKQGYDKGDIKGHVYDDVSPALELWRSVEDNKVYIYSSGSVQAQKLLFGQSSAGDMLKLIDGHFDTAVGAKQESKSYTAIVESIGCKPEDILFLTDIVKEAEAARTAGVHAALVTREGNAALPADVSATFPVLHSFTQLAVSNKRKPEQDITEDEQPAKVLKTDADVDVKTATEAESDTKTEDKTVSEKIDEVQPKVVEETEKMEVEDVVPPPKTSAETKIEEVKDKIETVVAEVTDAEVVDAQKCDMEPIVDETSDKTEQKETEKMDTAESIDAMKVEEPIEKPEIKNGQASPVETQTVITEIEDVTNNKEILNEVDEIIEGLEPIVEEPPAQDMEELANVGHELEKECDEILTKVQDVTNLDNIPIKPLLNTIAEETMETENTDTNDIVDRILDREEELENKASGDATVTNGVATLEQSEAELKPDVNENDKPIAKEPESAESQKSEVITEAEKITEDLSTKDDSCPKETTVEQSEKINEQAKQEIVTKNVEMDSKPDTESANVEHNKIEEKSDVDAKPIETEKEPPSEQTTETSSVETQENKVSDEVKPDTKEVHVNGKTNGDASITVNGDSKDNLSSRLSMENGNGVVNGANGDSNEVDQVKNESKELEVADIKVKTVATDEPRNDPIEQPTEA